MEISSNIINELTAIDSSVIPVVLLTFSHRNFVDDIRLSTDNKEVVAQNEVGENIYGMISRNKNYIAIPFVIKLPTSSAKEAPRTSISISNIGLDLIPLIRNLSAKDGELRVKMEVVTADSPDEVLLSFSSLFVSNINYDTTTMNGDLTSNDLAIEPFPSGTITPADFAAIFHVI